MPLNQGCVVAIGVFDVHPQRGLQPIDISVLDKREDGPVLVERTRGMLPIACKTEAKRSEAPVHGLTIGRKQKITRRRL